MKKISQTNAMTGRTGRNDLSISDKKSDISQEDPVEEFLQSMSGIIDSIHQTSVFTDDTKDIKEK